MLNGMVKCDVIRAGIVGNNPAISAIFISIVLPHIIHNEFCDRYDAGVLIRISINIPSQVE